MNHKHYTTLVSNKRKSNRKRPTIIQRSGRRQSVVQLQEENCSQDRYGSPLSSGGKDQSVEQSGRNLQGRVLVKR